MKTPLVVVHRPEYCSRQCASFDLLPTDGEYSFCRAWSKWLSWGDPGLPDNDSAPKRCEACIEDDNEKLSRALSKRVRKNQ